MNKNQKATDNGPEDALERAYAFHKEGAHTVAYPLYCQYLAIEPGNARVWGLLAQVLREMGHSEPSIAANRKALQLDPGLDVARRGLYRDLANLGHYTEVEPYFRARFEANPDHPKALRDYCTVLSGLGRHAQVLAVVDAAEARLGSIDRVIWPRASSNLTRRNFAQGFEDYEHRYIGDDVRLPENAPWPLWRGEDLTGKSILIVPEQGFGDTMVMARFLPQLKARGGEITMHVKAPLIRLFSRLHGLDYMVDAARASHKADYYLPDMSLPHRLGLPDGAPPPMARLHIPEESRARARALTAGHGDTFKIGVVWTGSSQFRGNKRRSINPESFIGLTTVPGVQLFSLYKGEFHSDLQNSGMAGLIADACGSDQDFADTAAVIEQMDLLITTDTAVVHLGGSLGKPVWNMLQREGYWYYGEEEQTPWYPSMRLFRQRSDQGWPDVLARVEVALREHLETLTG